MPERFPNLAITLEAALALGLISPKTAEPYSLQGKDTIFCMYCHRNRDHISGASEGKGMITIIVDTLSAGFSNDAYLNFTSLLELIVKDTSPLTGHILMNCVVVSHSYLLTPGIDS